MPRLDRQHEKTDMAERIFDLRMQGRGRTEIAQIVGLSAKMVDKHIRQQIEGLRLKNEELADEMYHIHQERLEELYALVRQEVDRAEVFDASMFKTMIQILERQSKLLGLDAAPKDRGPKRKDENWFLDATPHELIAEVESYGLEVPARFKLPCTPEVLRADRGNFAPLLASDTALGTASGPEDSD